MESEIEQSPSMHGEIGAGNPLIVSNEKYARDIVNSTWLSNGLTVSAGRFGRC